MHEKLELVHLYIADEEIVTTPEHPFWVVHAEWCSAIEIRAGDILKLADGSTVTVTSTRYEKLDTPVKVYNFEVEDFHTYYVGEQAVLVHNKCIVNDEGVRVEVRTSNEHGIPHAHVSGNGPKTTVGLDRMPMRGHEYFSKKQEMIINEHWEEIERGIRQFFPKTH